MLYHLQCALCKLTVSQALSTDSAIVYNYEKQVANVHVHVGKYGTDIIKLSAEVTCLFCKSTYLSMLCSIYIETCINISYDN